MTTDLNSPTRADLRWQSSALLALQEATEAYLVHLFEDAWAFYTIFNICVLIHNTLEIFAQYTQRE